MPFIMNSKENGAKVQTQKLLPAFQFFTSTYREILKDILKFIFILI